MVMKPLDRSLMMSYILAASLELALTLRMYYLDTGLQWAFGILLLGSLIAIPVENSQLGQETRQQLAEQGIPSEKYDLTANWGKSAIYCFILAGIMPLTLGVVLAYGCVVGSALLAFGKMR